MKVNVELLPAINRIVSDCEFNLGVLMGVPVRVSLTYVPAEINETTLQGLVCENFNVYWHELIGTKRNAEIVRARHAYWWLCQKWLESTCTKLARDFDKDHTSVLHGVARIQNLLDAKDMLITGKIRKIESMLSEVVNKIPDTEIFDSKDYI